MTEDPITPFYAHITQQAALALVANRDDPQAHRLVELLIAVERAYPVACLDYLLSIGVKPGPNLDAALTAHMRKNSLQDGEAGAPSDHSSTMAPAEEIQTMNPGG